MATDWHRMPLQLRPEQVARLDEWRRKQADLPDRSEAIRRLLDMALTAEGLPPEGEEK